MVFRERQRSGATLRSSAHPADIFKLCRLPMLNMVVQNLASAQLTIAINFYVRDNNIAALTHQSR